MLLKEGELLRIFISEKDRHGRLPLYEWIVRQAREHGLAGITVLRGFEGFGTHKHMHTTKILVLSMDLPIVIEILDTPENIETFLPIIDGAMKGGIATLEDVHIRFYHDRYAVMTRRRFTRGVRWLHQLKN